MPPRAIVHLDLDCFYAQVEMRRLGLGSSPWTTKESTPVAVQQWDGLIAVNYAARASGVKRGMRATEASQICPGLRLVHVETIGPGTTGTDPDRRTQKACLRRYREASEEVFAIFERHAARCEVASIDEAYLDLTMEASKWLTEDRLSATGRLDALAADAICAPGTSLDLEEDVLLIAASGLVEQLRAEVLAETGFTVSAGISDNKLCAKLGSACNKPNRQTLVPRGSERLFMESVPLKELRGLGGKLGEKLRAAMGFDPDTLCSELIRVPQTELQKHLGDQHGAFVWRLARGIDSEEVVPNMKRKQYLSFKSFLPWVQDAEALDPWLTNLAGELAERVLGDATRLPRTLVLHHRGHLDENHGRNWFKGKAAELTKTVSRSCPFPSGAITAMSIVAAAKKLMREKIETPFPCSRVAIGATDFVDVQKGPSITSLLQARPGVDRMKAAGVGSTATSSTNDCDGALCGGAAAVHGCEARGAGGVARGSRFAPGQDVHVESDVASGGAAQAVCPDQVSEYTPQVLLSPSPTRRSFNPKDDVAEQAASSNDVESIRRHPSVVAPRASDAQVASFHRASRLHFLGTWRERFEQWQRTSCGTVGLNCAAANVLKDAVASLQGVSEPCWAHVDMDCFFASVATRDLPDGNVVPTAVTSGLGNSSEICSANYAARRLGVTTALWSVERARAVLPTLKLIPVTEQLLRAVEATWQQVYQLLVVASDGQLDRVLMRSCDEAAVRVHVEQVVAWAEALRQAVLSLTRCTCSVGVGPSQVVAKIAVKACKPDGVKHVLSEEVEEFLADMPTTDLPQVGRSLAAKLEEHGLRCCRDLLQHDRGQLRHWFGVKGEMLWANARGQDYGTVAQQSQRKTMSAEINWGVRLRDRGEALKMLAEVVHQLSERLSSADATATQLTLKLKIALPGWKEPIKKGGHGACEDLSRSAVLPHRSRESSALLRCATHLFDAAAPIPTSIRGVGLAARLADSIGTDQGGLGKWLRQAGAQSSPQRTSLSGPRSPDVELVVQDLEEIAATEVDETDGEEHGLEPRKASSSGLAAGAVGRARAPSPDHAIIDLVASEGDSHGTALQSAFHGGLRIKQESSDSLVACPVCGVLQESSRVESHVNGHFDLSVPIAGQSLAMQRPPFGHGEVEVQRPSKRMRRTMLDYSSKAPKLDSDCEVLE